MTAIERFHWNSVYTHMHNGLALVKHPRADMTWSHLCKDTYPYYVGTGLSSRATCRSCGYQYDKSMLRVRTTLLRKLPSGSIRPCEINLCINWACMNMQTVMKQERNNSYMFWVRTNCEMVLTLV